ncbi:MAG: hypothetical protein CMI60_23590 [Parvibaculum sp.]|nr:hypothetical protein [Parvibaculum sp.]
MKSDYLKYWRVIRQFIKSKYGLTQADLDMLLFLYTEDYFSKDKFQEFNELLSWDVTRFDRLRRDKWIEVFRRNMGKRKALYTLSYKTKRMIDSLYKKLNGEEIPTSPSKNPMFKRNVKYSDKVYRNFIKDMNASIRQQRHK